MLMMDGDGVQMSELKSGSVRTMPENEPTVVPTPVVGLVCWMASVNSTASEGTVTLPDPVSWKLPRLTTLPEPIRPAFSAFGMKFSVNPPPEQLAPSGDPPGVIVGRVGDPQNALVKYPCVK